MRDIVDQLRDWAIEQQGLEIDGQPSLIETACMAVSAAVEIERLRSLVVTPEQQAVLDAAAGLAPALIAKAIEVAADTRLADLAIGQGWTITEAIEFVDALRASQSTQESTP